VIALSTVSLTVIRTFRLADQDIIRKVTSEQRLQIIATFHRVTFAREDEERLVEVGLINGSAMRVVKIWRKS